MPHADETFYKMKCGWVDDPKVATLARFGPVDACLARYVFGQMIDYARRELTDGLVPGAIVGQLAHPLPGDEGMRIAMLLADPGTYGPLCDWHADRITFRILAYGKWNDTRAEVQARTIAGRTAARARWHGDSNATRMPAAHDATRIHRARAQVHTEQEQEQEKPSSARAPAREDANGQGDDDDELLNTIKALIFPIGAISHDQARAYRDRVLAGRTVDDPRSYVVAAIRRDTRAAHREATAAVPIASARRQPPAAGRICHRCSKTGHRPEDCPLLAPAPADDRERVAAVGGPQLARDLLKPAADAMRHTPDADAAAEDDGPPNPADYPY